MRGTVKVEQLGDEVGEERWRRFGREVRRSGEIVEDDGAGVGRQEESKKISEDLWEDFWMWKMTWG